VLSRLFGKSKSGAPGVTETSAAAPFVITDPVAGFLNLNGARSADLLREDADALGRYFIRTIEAVDETPRCDVLFVYCDVDPDGAILGDPAWLQRTIGEARAYIAIVATENDPEGYFNMQLEFDAWHANVVYTSERKDPAFANFYLRLFDMMERGVSMLMAWVEIAPQIPDLIDPTVPSQLMSAQAGHLTFAPTAALD
jgi:hypothetical protein